MNNTDNQMLETKEDFYELYWNDRYAAMLLSFFAFYSLHFSLFIVFMAA